MSESTTAVLGGIVLCGGASRRMGRDKASLPFGSETLLQRVVRRLAEVAHPLVVVAARNQVLPSVTEDVLVVRDAAAGRGPWQGISAGLHALRGRVDAAFVTSCDSPFLRPGWIRRLRELLGDHTCAVPLIAAYPQPLAAVYRLQALPHIDQLLASETNRPHLLFETVATRFVLEHELLDVDPTLESLRNINSPDEYRQAIADAGVPAI